MIVIGYGGNDESLMNYLKEIKDRKPIYWCCRNVDKLSDNIKDLLGKKDFLVEIRSFDKFMLLLSYKLEFEDLIDPEDIKKSQIVKDAIARAEAYSKQRGELTKEDLNKREQDAIKKLLPNWWDYELAVRGETDLNKKDKLYQEGTEAHPKSHDLMGYYAFFLSYLRKDYDKAEEYYKKALILDPEHPVLNGNYANFLTIKLKNHDKAEKYYQKSIEFDPKNATRNGNYAYFLKYIRKNFSKAEEYYKKALASDPDNAYSNSNYAQFLLVTGRKSEANKYMKNAFYNIETETDLALELWFYRLAHYPEFLKQAKNKLDGLLAEGHKSSHWSFDDNIKQAEQDGFKDIQLLKDYAKKITQE